eukprot:359054-Chlamydomonas_euryale.AAC.4
MQSAAPRSLVMNLIKCEAAAVSPEANSRRCRPRSLLVGLCARVLRSAGCEFAPLVRRMSASWRCLAGATVACCPTAKHPHLLSHECWVAPDVSLPRRSDACPPASTVVCLMSNWPSDCVAQRIHTCCRTRCRTCCADMA